MQRDPALVELFTDALSRQARGDAPGALLAYRRIQRRFPDFPDAWANASAMLSEMGRFEEALASAERAAELDAEIGGPSLAILFNLARAREGLGLTEGAAEAYRGAIALDPGHAQALHGLSELLCRAGRFGEALAVASRALDAEPESPRAHYNLGLAHQGEGRAGEAVGHYRAVLMHDAGHAAAAARLASVYIGLGHFAEAIELCDLCGAAAEHSATPSARSILLMYRGNAKVRLMDFAGAEADLSLALELGPANASIVRQDLVYLLALQGRYGEAWAHARAHRRPDGDGGDDGYARAQRRPEGDGGDNGGDGYARAHRGDGGGGFGGPRWDGGPLEGGTLLVRGDSHQTGGYGDVIQFSRFFPRIRDKCGCRLFLYTYGSLKRLMEGLPGLDGAVADGDALPRFDAVATVGELPCLADVDLSDLPPPTDLSSSLRPGSPMPGPGSTFRIGLTWAGSASTAQRATRDMDPRLFDALADVPGAEGIAWYGLQKPPDDGPGGMPNLPGLPGIIDLSPLMGDFLDTARIVAQLDLVVTVDTSMAHLAGSLGVPTMVLLPRLPDWRWGLGESTPWYPGMTLVRQASHGDWRGAVEKLKTEIAGRVMAG